MDVNPRELLSEVILSIKGITQQKRCTEEVNNKIYEDKYLIIMKNLLELVYIDEIYFVKNFFIIIKKK